MRRLVILVVCISIGTLHLTAQPLFQQVTGQWKKLATTRSVIPGAMVDINGDLIDDIVALDKGTKAIYLESRGKFVGLNPMDTVQVAASTEWTLSCGDLNNDGIPEVITAGEYGPVSVLQWDSPSQSFVKSTLPANIYAQGSATIDINRDGWLDYFVANDVGYSRFYINDKKGKLQFGQVIDFQAGDATDGSGNYGIEWTDVNHDGLPDLYISKCRAGVENPADLRRINRLYMQQADGTFVDRAREYGVASGDQSWAATFGDLDNDGDQDLFLANHYVPHQIFENVEGKKFVPVDLDVNLQSFVFQLIMRDFDNDGSLDILYAGAEGITLLHNKGSFQFERIQKPLGPNLIRSFTCGDVNDDGFPDIHAHLGEPINEIGPKDDELWFGEANGNNFIKCTLQGKKSNASAVGARLFLYGPWGVQSRIVKGGEGYGVFHTFQQHFGIGKNKTIDSLVVFWPSGGKDVFTSLMPGQIYLVQEGECITPRYRWEQNTKIATQSEKVNLSAPEGYVTYLWNNKKEGQSLDAGEGIYWVRMRSEDGCETITEPVQVLSGCFKPNEDILSYSSPVDLCRGQSITVGCRPAASYNWNTGDTTQWIRFEGEGLLSVTASDFCGNSRSDSIVVRQTSANLTVKSDTILDGHKAVLISDHPLTRWYTDQAREHQVAVGDTFVTDFLYQTTTYFAQAERVVQSKSSHVGEDVYPSTNLYGANSVLGGLVFSVLNDCIIRSVHLNTDTEGSRRIIIKSQDGKEIFARDIWLSTGITKVNLEARLVPGDNYTITFDETVNLVRLGYKSPRLVRTFTTTHFPYEINNVVTIQSSTYGALYYYYFYDWEVEHELLECQSELIPVEAVVLSSGILNPENPIVQPFFPNPAFDRIRIQWPHDALNAEIYQNTGREMDVVLPSVSELDIAHWPEGWYIVKINTVLGQFHFRLMKM